MNIYEFLERRSVFTSRTRHDTAFYMKMHAAADIYSYRYFGSNYQLCWNIRAHYRISRGLRRRIKLALLLPKTAAILEIAFGAHYQGLPFRQWISPYLGLSWALLPACNDSFWRAWLYTLRREISHRRSLPEPRRRVAFIVHIINICLLKHALPMQVNSPLLIVECIIEIGASRR